MTEQQLAAHTEDLSLFGCFVETLAPFPAPRSDCEFHALAQISSLKAPFAYSRNNGGMGIAFTSIEPSCVSILDAWLTGMRN